MIEHFGGLISVVMVTFATPFAGALTPLALPLPQQFDWQTYVTAQLVRAAFSTELRGQVAAEQDAQPQPLQAFITNNQVCLREREDLSYHMVIRNVSAAAIQDITVQFQYPQTTTFRDSDPKPAAEELPEVRLVEWHIDELAPGATSNYSVIITVTQPIENVTVNVTVFYRGGQTLTSHTIDGPCSAKPAPAAPRQNKQPAIVCDPAEINCVDTRFLLNLGPNWQKLLNNPGQGHVECGEEGCPIKPNLGVRFNEAIADILPGECRVLPDDVIAHPEFHDALNRRAKPAAGYMFPLYRSGLDFRGLAVENEQLGLTHNLYARTTLQKIHTKHWQKQVKDVQAVLDGEQATGVVQGKIDQWDREFIQETETAQQDLQRHYQDMQEKRRIKFDPIATKAVNNATQSILAACGVPSDGGLSGLLPAVKQAYELTLQAQIPKYTQVQQRFIQPDVFTGAKAWQQDLRAALTSFDQNNPKPLQNYLLNIPTYDRVGFEKAWQATYQVHGIDDQTQDNRVRLGNWESALDAPKAVATKCEQENISPPKVESSWCESGTSPELIIREAPAPAKKDDIRPPEKIDDGEDAIILESNVRGDVCGGAPGDPYWTLNCRCHCGQLVPCGGQMVLCEDYYNKVLAGQCVGDQTDRLLRHDVHVTSQLECLWDGDKHEDPYF